MPRSSHRYRKRQDGMEMPLEREIGKASMIHNPIRVRKYPVSRTQNHPWSFVALLDRLSQTLRRDIRRGQTRKAMLEASDV